MEIKYTLEDFNKNKIIDKYGIQENGSSQLFLANTCFKRMTKYVPKDTGTLRSTVTVRPGSVTYEVPYAHAQYVGRVGKTRAKVKEYTTPRTGTYWDRKMKSAEGHLVAREVEAYMKKLKGSS